MVKKDISKIDSKQKNALVEISTRFGVVETVNSLRNMMNEVTKKELNADTVNAACNCVQNINLTIKTSIQAARFLTENDD